MDVSSQWETLVWNVFFSNVAAFVACTVLVFDHLLTFANEVEYIWRRRMTPFSVLFLLNRYFTLAGMLRIVLVSVLAAKTDSGCASCDPQIALFMPSTITVLISELILILRVYAVYNHTRAILGLVSSVWLLHLVSMSCVLGGAGSLPKPELFFITLPESSWVREIASLKLSKTTGLLYIVPAILFDAVVGTLLTLGLYRISRPHANMMPLVRLIIRDGMLYCTVVFLTNIAWMLLLILEDGGTDNDIIRFLPLEYWSSCITTTMIGRLTLNLRMHNPGANELTFQAMTLRFGQHSSTIPPDNEFDGGA